MSAHGPGSLRRGDGRGPDAGFTLVELVVAMTILAVGIVAVIGVTSSSFGVAVKTSQRNSAVNLATKEIEATRAVPYKDLLAQVGTYTTSTTVVKGTTFTVERALQYASDGGNPQAYVKAVVNVSWADGAGVHDVAQTTNVYPGGQVPVTSTTVSCAGGPAADAPTGVVATVPLGVEGMTGIDVVWVPAVTGTAVSTWAVQWSADNGASWNSATASLDQSITSMRVTGLSSNTTYKVRVGAITACGTVTWSAASAAVTTLSELALTCTPATPTVTPTQVKRKSGSSSAGLATRPVVTLNTSGVCTGFTIKYRPTPSNERTVALVLGLGGVWSAGLSGATTDTWDVGPHDIDVYDAGGTKRGTIVLTVCEHNARDCG